MQLSFSYKVYVFNTDISFKLKMFYLSIIKRIVFNKASCFSFDTKRLHLANTNYWHKNLHKIWKKSKYIK